jgi:hypothetical protein
MSTFTPGPWVAREVGGMGWPGQRGFAIDFNEDQEQVVDFVYEEADAHLIAAAPDLLEALEDSLTALNIVYPNGSPVLNAAYAAIAKARGEA